MVFKRTCTQEGCTRKHYAKGYCEPCYVKRPDRVAVRKFMQAKLDKAPKRKKQKAAAQLVYAAGLKGSHTRLKAYLRKRKKELLTSIEELGELRAKPCAVCEGPIGYTGYGVSVVDMRLPITKDNLMPCCGVCRLAKPKEDFDRVKFCKHLIKGQWKRTPMASIAIARTKRGPAKHECEKCHKIIHRSQMQLDHISPVIPVDRTEATVPLLEWIQRLLCDESNLQFLCKPCHAIKTEGENVIRREHKRAAQKNTL